MRGKCENFFSREKKPNVGFGILSLSPRAPLTLSRKAKNFFNYALPAYAGSRAQKTNRGSDYEKMDFCLGNRFSIRHHRMY